VCDGEDGRVGRKRDRVGVELARHKPQCLLVEPDDRRRPLASRLWRALGRRAGGHRDRLRHAPLRLLRRARSRAQAADDRQRLGLHAQPLAARATRRAQRQHVRTPYRRPQPNGKVERFHQTMAREWAYGLRYRSSRHRANALPHWLAYYNERRPHSSLGGLPPISRVHNLCGQDS
jgi:hypothetical protein